MFPAYDIAGTLWLAAAIFMTPAFMGHLWFLAYLPTVVLCSIALTKPLGGTPYRRVSCWISAIAASALMMTMFIIGNMINLHGH